MYYAQNTFISCVLYCLSLECHTRYRALFCCDKPGQDFNITAATVLCQKFTNSQVRGGTNGAIKRAATKLL